MSNKNYNKIINKNIIIKDDFLSEKEDINVTKSDNEKNYPVKNEILYKETSFDQSELGVFKDKKNARIDINENHLLSNIENKTNLMNTTIFNDISSPSILNNSSKINIPKNNDLQTAQKSSNIKSQNNSINMENTNYEKSLNYLKENKIPKNNSLNIVDKNENDKLIEKNKSTNSFENKEYEENKYTNIYENKKIDKIIKENKSISSSKSKEIKSKIEENKSSDIVNIIDNSHDSSKMEDRGNKIYINFPLEHKINIINANVGKSSSMLTNSKNKNIKNIDVNVNNHKNNKNSIINDNQKIKNSDNDNKIGKNNNDYKNKNNETYNIISNKNEYIDNKILNKDENAYNNSDTLIENAVNNANLSKLKESKSTKENSMHFNIEDSNDDCLIFNKNSSKNDDNNTEKEQIIIKEKSYISSTSKLNDKNISKENELLSDNIVINNNNSNKQQNEKYFENNEILNNKNEDNNNLFYELFPKNENIDERKERALKVIYNELLDLAEPTILLKKVINVFEKRKKSACNKNNINESNKEKINDNYKRILTENLEYNTMKRIKLQNVNNNDDDINNCLDNNSPIENIKNKSVIDENKKISENMKNIIENELSNKINNTIINKSSLQILDNRHINRKIKTPESTNNTEVNQNINTTQILNNIATIENVKTPQNINNKIVNEITKTPKNNINTEINKRRSSNSINSISNNSSSINKSNEVLIVSNVSINKENSTDDDEENTTITLVKIPFNDDLLDTIIKSKKYKVIETNQKNINMDIINDTPQLVTPNSKDTDYNNNYNSNKNSINNNKIKQNLIPLVEIKKEIEDNEYYGMNKKNTLLKKVKKDNNAKEDQTEILQHLFDHSSSYIPTRRDSNRDSFGNASTSSANLYEEDDEPLDMEKINSIRLAGISERNKKRLIKIMRGKGKHIPKQRSIKIKSRKEILSENSTNKYHEIKYNHKYNFNYDNNEESSSDNEIENEILSNQHHNRSMVYDYQKISDKKSRKHNINNDMHDNENAFNNDNMEENYHHYHHHHKKQKRNYENSIIEKNNALTKYIEEKESLKPTKKSKSIKKICPLFRKIKVLEPNSKTKDHKEGKYQFLHQKLYLDNNSPTENIQNKNKQNNIEPDSSEFMFDNTINTNDIAYHLTLYNIQKYREKRPVNKSINNILVNFEKNITKEFILMNYEMKRRNELMKILDKTKRIKENLLKKKDD